MNHDLMRVIDKPFLETPFYGLRQMTWHLRNEDHLVNEKRIRRLMRLLGLLPVYQKPNTSKAAKGHKIYPSLLRGLRVDRPNQVWCADITYLPPLGRLLCNRRPGNGCAVAFCMTWLSVSGGDPLAGRRLSSIAVRHGLA